MHALHIARVVSTLPGWARRHKVVKLLLSVSPASCIQEVRFNGRARLVADLRDPFPRAYLLSGQFEPEFFEIAGPFLHTGGVFVDARQGFGPEDVLGPLRSANYEPLYVKEVDFRRLAQSVAVNTITVGGRKLRVSPVGVFPTGHQTDVLAVHRDKLAEWQAL